MLLLSLSAATSGDPLLLRCFDEHARLWQAEGCMPTSFAELHQCHTAADADRLAEAEPHLLLALRLEKSRAGAATNQLGSPTPDSGAAYLPVVSPPLSPSLARRH